MLKRAFATGGVVLSLMAAQAVAAQQPTAARSGFEIGSGAPAEWNLEGKWLDADRLQLAGNLEGGLEAFLEIAQLQQAAGINSARALWRVAEIRHALGNHLQTARALDAVAEEAGAFGQYDIEAQALFESAVYYSGAKRPEEASDRIARLQLLLASRVVTTRKREELNARIYRQRRSWFWGIFQGDRV